MPRLLLGPLLRFVGDGCATVWVETDVLLSTVPSAMLFDDHDVRDDWNTSRAWRDSGARLDCGRAASRPAS